MGMMAGQYKTRLGQSLQAMNDANVRASNYRSFNKPSDDPFAAAQTYQIRRETQQNNAYQSNLSNVQSSLKTAESTVNLVSSIISTANSSDVCGAVNGTMTKDTRSAVVKKLRAMRESIVSDMNAKYSDQYLFGGAGASSAPFTVGNDGSLLYRGINVDTGINTNGASTAITNETSSTQINFGKENAGLFNDYKINVVTGSADGVSVSGKSITVTLENTDVGGNSISPTKEQLQKVLQNNLKSALNTAGIPATDTDKMHFDQITVDGNLTDAATVSKTGESSEISNKVDLDDLANEKVYIDLGFGLQFDENSNILPQSAYNSALPGITFLGYGMNTDGTPKNAYSVMGKIADMLESDTVSLDAISPYWDSLQQTADSITTQISEIGAKETFLTTTQTHLEDTNTNLLSKGNDVEFVEPYDAIMDWMTQQFCYQACLQMGTNILQPTLMDFLK